MTTSSPLQLPLAAGAASHVACWQTVEDYTFLEGRSNGVVHGTTGAPIGVSFLLQTAEEWRAINPHTHHTPAAAALQAALPVGQPPIPYDAGGPNHPEETFVFTPLGPAPTNAHLKAHHVTQTQALVVDTVRNTVIAALKVAYSGYPNSFRGETGPLTDLRIIRANLDRIFPSDSVTVLESIDTSINKHLVHGDSFEEHLASFEDHIRLSKRASNGPSVYDVPTYRYSTFAKTISVVHPRALQLYTETTAPANRSIEGLAEIVRQLIRNLPVSSFVAAVTVAAPSAKEVALQKELDKALAKLKKQGAGVKSAAPPTYCFCHASKGHATAECFRKQDLIDLIVASYPDTELPTTNGKPALTKKMLNAKEKSDTPIDGVPHGLMARR